MTDASALPVLRLFLRHNIRAIGFGGLLRRAKPVPPAGHDVPIDFFGICVAPGDQPECETFLVQRLRELNVRHVRVDFTYASPGGPAASLLQRLAQEGFRVLLHVVQPFEEARAMPCAEAMVRWEAFLADTLTQHGEAIDMLEVGSTCNRRKWAGYSLEGFFAAWDAAVRIARERGVRLAGPNVTDFEPAYNIALLGEMARRGQLPDVHTDNLFAERATEPEAYDHKIMGHALAPVLKYNLVRKASLLRGITEWAGLRHLFCTHVAWSLRRIDRILPDTEEKQADYVSRYCALAAASGAMDRVYWGPLVGQREGLIDDGTTAYPELPHVTLYATVPGRVADYRVRPAFRAFQTVHLFLSGTQYVRPWASGSGLEIHEFLSGEKRIHVAWTRNAGFAPAGDCYDAADLARATCFDRDGGALLDAPPGFTESPIFLTWPTESHLEVRPGASTLPGVSFRARPGTGFTVFDREGWHGVAACRSGSRDPLVSPDQLEQGADREIMRDRRNCVWHMPSPALQGEAIVVKRMQIRKPYKRLIQRFRAGRALKSWNGAIELLRRGVPTPAPVAFFQRAGDNLADSYFVYRYFRADGSMRDVLTAFAQGKETYRDIPADVFYSRLAEFLANMHRRGVYFRDLSAGNVLVRFGDSREMDFCLIDTARARFHTHALDLRTRLRDLRRILHPLHWQGRRAFLDLYMAHLDRPVTRQMLLPLVRYDTKHWIKDRIRGKKRWFKRRKKKRTPRDVDGTP